MLPLLFEFYQLKSVDGMRPFLESHFGNLHDPAPRAPLLDGISLYTSLDYLILMTQEVVPHMTEVCGTTDLAEARRRSLSPDEGKERGESGGEDNFNHPRPTVATRHGALKTRL
jgi:hypothetical protein